MLTLKITLLNQMKMLENFCLTYFSSKLNFVTKIRLLLQCAKGKKLENHHKKLKNNSRPPIFQLASCKKRLQIRLGHQTFFLILDLSS